MRTFKVPLSCILLLAVAAGHFAQAAPPTHFGDMPRITCAEGIERYLPGDYYFCAANKALQAGDARKSRAMYEESAAWGDKRAMFNLGVLHLRGEGLPRDEALGLAWLVLASERPDDRTKREVLAGAWQGATPETRVRADALWNAMKPKYADAVALRRARVRYDRETRLLRRELQRDPTIWKWIAGLPPAQPGGGLLETLDAAASETVLRPSRYLKGAVNVGAPETVPDSPPAKP